TIEVLPPMDFPNTKINSGSKTVAYGIGLQVGIQLELLGGAYSAYKEVSETLESGEVTFENDSQKLIAAVWSTITKVNFVKKIGDVARKKKSVADGGDFVPNEKVFDLKKIGDSYELELFVEALSPSKKSGDVEIKFELDLDGDDKFDAQDVVTVTVIPTSIAADWTRDGQINGNDKGKVSKEKPWRWWKNDDDDDDSDPLTGLTTDVVMSVPDDLPGQGDQDCNDGEVNGVRDLIDFFPLKISDLPLNEFPLSNYQYSLKSDIACNGFLLEDSDVIQNLYQDFTTAQKYPSKKVIELDSKGITIEKVSADQSITVFIEAVTMGKGEIYLEVVSKETNNVLFTIPFYVEFSSVTDMFRQRTVRKVMGDNDIGTDKHNNVSLEIPNIPYNMAFDEQGNKVDNTLVWVHGYNVTGKAAEATFSEVFKRLYHQGFKGEYIGFTWFSNPATPGSLLSVPHYHQTVVNGFYASKLLADYLQKLSGKLFLTGHSMGRMVVSNTIEKYSPNYEKFFAINTAAALECYGATTVDNSMINIEGEINWSLFDFKWRDCWDKDKRLFASEWHTLFADIIGDERNKLTWRNTLTKNIADGKMINFYSSTEEVLRKYNDFHVDGGATYAWVKQEKFKGLTDGISSGGMDSPFCGYSVNNDSSSYWSLSGEIEKGTNIVNDSNYISDERLRENPFFRLSVKSSFPLKELVGELSSVNRFLATSIDGSSLKNYYTYNQKVQPHVTVREFLLAEAFPATTLPLGANALGIQGFLDSNNIDMSSACKANVGNAPNYTWPHLEKINNIYTPVWHHSDYKDVPYLFTYPFYKKIVDEIK
ncbi:MAG: alpha/beta hydrolase, partial [Lentisphaeria bacterium]